MIRRAELRDIPDILDIFNDAIRNTTAIYLYQPQTLAEKQQWFADKTAAGEPVLVWEQEGKAVGFATYGKFREYPAYQYSIEHSVYVRQEYRGRGIGRALMERLLEEAERQGYHVMIAVIDSENQASIALHQQLGFVPTGEIRQSGYKFGRWLDVVLYEYFLPGSEIPPDRVPR